MSSRHDSWKLSGATPRQHDIPLKTGILASHITTRLDSDGRKRGVLTTTRLLSNPELVNNVADAIYKEPERSAPKGVFQTAHRCAAPDRVPS
jgi:hypothetical protein